MRAAGGSQVVRTANPDAAFEGLEAHAYPFGPPHSLRPAGNLPVGKIRLNQVDQGGTGLAGIRGRQGMRENARLYLIAPRRIAEHRALEPVEHHQHGTQCVVGHIAGTPGAAHEFEMQQPAHAAALVVQAKRQGAVQFGDQEHGLGRDMVRVGRDRDFRQIFRQMGIP